LSPFITRRKPAACSKVFRPGGDFLQRGAGFERAVLVAVGDDVLRQGRVEAGDARQQRHRGGVHVHAHGVHAVLDHRIQAARQFQLRHVVLVLADADGFRVDLHQLGQRVLQAAGDRHGATDRHVQVREFLGASSDAEYTDAPASETMTLVIFMAGYF
jgi:hypothetical protein